MRVLVAGESWVTHTVHIKGFDSFVTSGYEEGVRWLKAALEKAGHTVHHMPNHLVATDFPSTVESLRRYEVVMLSDCGSNTLLHHPDTFIKSQKTPNRLQAIRDYVAGGGALVMIGGYMTFQGIDGRARYHGTPVEEALPVNISQVDDRVEIPEGVVPLVANPEHPVVRGIDGEWPAFLGYNRLAARSEADVLATAGNDPFLVVWQYGKGRSAAFASDCGPHWGPEEYLNWHHHDRLWAQLVAWLAEG